MLRYNIQIATEPDDTKSIVIASSTRGEGRSTAALNLALSIAQDEKTVILVDADVLKPSLANRLGLTPGPGLTDVVAGTEALEDVIRDTSIPGLKFVGAGTILSKAAEMLQTDKVKEVHSKLREMADFVVFDTPPALSSVDAAIISSVADAAVYLAKLDVTPTQSLRRGTSLLRAAHARLVGIVFSDARGEVDPTLDMFN